MLSGYYQLVFQCEPLFRESKGRNQSRDVLRGAQPPGGDLFRGPPGLVGNTITRRLGRSGPRVIPFGPRQDKLPGGGSLWRQKP